MVHLPQKLPSGKAIAFPSSQQYSRGYAAPNYARRRRSREKRKYRNGKAQLFRSASGEAAIGRPCSEKRALARSNSRRDPAVQPQTANAPVGIDVEPGMCNVAKVRELVNERMPSMRLKLLIGKQLLPRDRIE